MVIVNRSARGEIARLRHDRDHARFEPRDVEEVLHESDHPPRLSLDVVERALRAIGIPSDRLLRELREAEDDGERRAQIVVRHREELPPTALQIADRRDVVEHDDRRGDGALTVAPRSARMAGSSSRGTGSPSSLTGCVRAIASLKLATSPAKSFRARFASS